MIVPVQNIVELVDLHLRMLCFQTFLMIFQDKVLQIFEMKLFPNS